MLEDRIHTTVKRTLVYKFRNEIKKGKCYSFSLVGVASNIGGFKTNHHPYKLIFQFSTKVILLEDGAVPNIVYDLVPISTIMDGGLDVDYLVGKVSLQNSINFDLIIISTIMLLWYLLDKMPWDCSLELQIRERTKRMARRPRWMWFNLRMKDIFLWKFIYSYALFVYLK